MDGAADAADVLSADGSGLPLRHRVTRGAATLLFGQGLRQAMAIATTAALARLVAPRDFGLFAMVGAVCGFVGLFAEMGLTAATVQRRVLTRAQSNALFWVNLALGLAASGMVAALAPLIARFYGHPELRSVAIWWGSGFALAGAGVQSRALLERRMRYRALLGLDVAALAIASTAAIGCAALGLGVWALVVQMLAMNACSTSGALLLAHWRPGRPRGAPGLRELVAVGANLLGWRALGYFTRNLDNLVIGRLMGAVPLGYYTRAYQLMLYPVGALTQPLRAVMLPALSRLQDDPERLAKAYVKSLRVVIAVCAPITLLTVTLADEVVLTVYGVQWRPAIHVLRILALAGLWEVVFNSIGWLFVVVGRTDRQLRWGLISAPLICAGFLIGARWGVAGVAWSYTVVLSALAYPYMRYAYGTAGVQLGHVATALGPVLLSAAGAGAATGLVREVLAGLGMAAWARLLSGLLVYAVLYGAFVRVLLPECMSEIRSSIARPAASDLRAGRPPDEADRDPAGRTAPDHPPNQGNP